MSSGRLRTLGLAAVALGLAGGLLGGIQHASARLVLTGWDPIVQIDTFEANITVNADNLSQVSAITYVVHVPVGTDKTKVKFTEPPAPVDESLTFAYDQPDNQIVVDTTTTAVAGGSTSVTVTVSQKDSILATVVGSTGDTLTAAPISLGAAASQKAAGKASKSSKTGGTLTIAAIRRN